MRSIGTLLIFFLIFSSTLSAQEKYWYNPSIDVQHYTFAIELSDDNDEIKTTAEITMRFQKDAQTITLDLIGKNAAGKGMVVTAVTEKYASRSFEQFADRLKINLSPAAKAGEIRTFSITYHGTPANGLVFSKNKFAQRTIFADNWPNRARNWLPCVDHLSDKASVDFRVTAPEHYKVISNGILVEESSLGDHKKFTHWKEAVALPTKVMVIGLADFAVNYAGMVDCIPVSSWVFPQDRKNGFCDYEQALEILPFFIKNIGPYAYQKLANVEAITIFGGMENASAIFYYEQSITGKRTGSEELIAHEIAHQWFGNSATEADWPHVWLSEGFATEMTNLYLENKYGPDTVKARLKLDRETVIQFSKQRFTPIVDSSEKVNFLKLLNRNSYEKGGWVLHMLRRKLGDVVFWKGIQNYYAAYAGSNATTADFKKIMEQVSGVDLNAFFKQWLFTAGHPVLDITWKYNEAKKRLVVRIVQQQDELFDFPLELTFEYGKSEKAHNQVFAIKEKLTEIELNMDLKPMKVIVDLATNLLYEGGIKEPKINTL